MVAKDCSYCGREGLLIYPVRYAIACPAGAARAPGLSGNFRVDGAPSEVATAKYTLRAVRTGYLYTYDEKRKRIKAYIVMPGGYLWHFPHDAPPPDPVSKPYQCTSPVDAALSMCVDVMHSDTNPAGIFWIGWSNIAWTPALLKKLERDDEWRRRHMRGVDIPWMLTGLRDFHTGEFSQNYKSIAHFSMTVKEMEKAFGFSNTPIDHEMRRMNKVDRFIRAFSMQTPIKNGYIVALDDPVGMTNDLSELTVPTDHSGFNVELYRGRIIEEILQAAETSVREHTRRDFDFDRSQKKFDDQHPSADVVSYSDVKEIFAVLKAGGPGNLATRKEEERKKYGESEIAQRKAAEDKAWEELSTVDGKPILDAKKRAGFPALYNSALKDFEERGIALAKAHAEWLSSDQLCRWMDGVHDRDNLSSGFAYRESLGQCIGKAAATNACDKQLLAWLSTADVENSKNLYARAMLFNQTEIVNATAAHIKGGDVKLKNILSIYKQGAERLKKGEELRLIDRLIFIIANSMLKALGQNINLAMRNLVLVNLTLLGKTVINVSNRSAHDVRNWIMNEASKKGIEFETDRSTTRSDALKAAKTIPTGRPLSPGICAYELDVAQLEQEGRIGPGSIKSIKIPGYASTVDLLGSSKDFNMGSVAVLLQLAAFAFAFRDFKKGDKFESNTYLAKLGIAVTSLSGALLELVGGVSEKAPKHPLSVALNKHWAQGEGAGSKTLALGKVVGLVAGLATAVFDLYMAYKSYNDGDNTLAKLYLINSILGGSLALAGYMAAAIFWPLFVAALVLSIVIAVAKESPIKKWFKHCFFSEGGGTENGYATLEEELSALNNALGG